MFNILKRKKAKIDMNDGIAMLQRIVTLNEMFTKDFGNIVKDWPVDAILDYTTKFNEGVK